MWYESCVPLKCSWVRNKHTNEPYTLELMDALHFFLSFWDYVIIKFLASSLSLLQTLPCALPIHLQIHGLFFYYYNIYVCMQIYLFVWGKVCHLDLRLWAYVRVAGEQAPAIFHYLLPQLWNYCQVPPCQVFTWIHDRMLVLPACLEGLLPTEPHVNSHVYICQGSVDES